MPYDRSEAADRGAMNVSAPATEGDAGKPNGPVRFVVVMRHAQVYRPTKAEDLCEHNVPAAHPKPSGCVTGRETDKARGDGNDDAFGTDTGRV